MKMENGECDWNITPEIKNCITKSEAALSWAKPVLPTQSSCYVFYKQCITSSRLNPTGEDICEKYHYQRYEDCVKYFGKPPYADDSEISCYQHTKLDNCFHTILLQDQTTKQLTLNVIWKEKKSDTVTVGDFTIKNSSSHDVKDIKILCKYPGGFSSSANISQTLKAGDTQTFQNIESQSMLNSPIPYDPGKSHCEVAGLIIQ